VCDSREGAVSSEDREVGLGAELGDDGQGAAAARPGKKRRPLIRQARDV
jgi:hypothetical protein